MSDAGTSDGDTTEAGELGSASRALLDSARAGLEPSDTDRARVRRAIAAGIAAAGASSVGASSAAASSAPPLATATSGGLQLGLAAKVALVFAMTTVAASGALYAGTSERRDPAVASRRATAPALATRHDAARAIASRHDTAPTTHRELAAPHTARQTDTLGAAGVDVGPRDPIDGAGLADSPSGSATHDITPPPSGARGHAGRSRVVTVSDAVTRRSARNGAGAAPPSRPASVDDLTAETALLGRARAALARRDATSGEAALAALAEHARRFPSGTLGEEREATLALALCAAGRRDEARAAARAFLASHAASPLAQRVRTACAAP